MSKAPKSTIYIRVQAPAGWRFVKPVVAKNYRLKPLNAIVNSQAEEHPEGCYYLRTVVEGKK